VLDAPYAADIRQMLDRDLVTSEELTRESFARRSLFQRLLERLAYAFRKWL